ncbi:cell wall biogenesis protein Mhp1 [Apiospora kogelbergensis]|uniref:Cell wall biogenesis protein Mhp1 n=1 Tax=Apiospora kogelbergensis TaxID=1337665 RepID=A0AAW0QXT9_9PEZI
MEQVMDVSWMTHGKDKLTKHNSAKWNASSPPTSPVPNQTQPSQPLETSTPSKVNGKTAVPSESPAQPSPTPTPAPAAKPIPQRSNVGRGGPIDEKKSPSGAGTPPQRRGSWFSKISSSFSSSPSPAQTPALASQEQLENDDLTPLPKITPSKNAVLPHGSKPQGEGPYVPAPPRSGQGSFLHVFRRLSSGGAAPPPGKNNHGLVERRVLNVDKTRERPRLNELNQAKLRRVAFCVDVEIAPMPKYVDSDPSGNKPAEKNHKRKISEKGEGDALKTPKAVEAQKETNGAVKATGEELSKVPTKEGVESLNEQPPPAYKPTDDTKPVEKETTRKKEKKKKSEAERKAKKEQKRKEALEKGCIPMELHFDSDSSSEEVTIPKGPQKPQSTPTTNPGRIYRRCCQLRETDILTKITQQLPKSTDGGMVEKLDLTGYFMSREDLVTLGDFLAVVPIKEVILEQCGLTDDGVRGVLSGLLSARKPTTKQHRRSLSKPVDPTRQGGVVERLVLKNNKLGVEGWKHICLFIHMCHSIKYLDLSSIPFPAPSPESTTSPLSHALHLHHGSNSAGPQDISSLLSKALAERLAGPELELLNIGETGITTKQLAALIDGLLKSGVTRLGLAHNELDGPALQEVARYLRDGKCQGLDLGGNNLRDNLEGIAEAINEDGTMWALSLANCNLKPGSLCKLLPKLTKVKAFKFLDLSHNHDLCDSEPSAISLLRRYLPQIDTLKRVHLADVDMSSEQAIALAEVLPECKHLAHINLLENPKLVGLADARTEDTQEEACALYASLLAAARVSDSLVKIDIDIPSVESGEIVKALANQALAHCLHNVHLVPDIRDHVPGEQVPADINKYPDVLRHIVGNPADPGMVDGIEDDQSEAADEDYVIGGTGVVKALACVLKNVGDDSRRQSGEFMRELETGHLGPRAHMPSGKAKDMSKHLLASARKIHARLQPALTRAKAASSKDMNNYSKSNISPSPEVLATNINLDRLVFLNSTIEGIIKRFEDEFPDTLAVSDNEDLEWEVKSPARSRSNSIMSSTSKALVEEEGRALRVGHKFRRGFLRQANLDLLTCSEVANEPEQKRMIEGLLDDLGPDGEDLRKKAAEEGSVKVFQQEREEIFRRLRDVDVEYWDRFIESQEKARANVQVPMGSNSTVTNAAPTDIIKDIAATATKPSQCDESAIAED